MSYRYSPFHTLPLLSSLIPPTPYIMLSSPCPSFTYSSSPPRPLSPFPVLSSLISLLFLTLPVLSTVASVSSYFSLLLPLPILLSYPPLPCSSSPNLNLFPATSLYLHLSPSISPSHVSSVFFSSVNFPCQFSPHLCSSSFSNWVSLFPWNIFRFLSTSLHKSCCPHSCINQRVNLFATFFPIYFHSSTRLLSTT